jgi:hypothetical protein
MVHSTALLQRSFVLILVSCAVCSNSRSGAVGQTVTQQGVPLQVTREAGLAAWGEVYSKKPVGGSFVFSSSRGRDGSEVDTC